MRKRQIGIAMMMTLAGALASPTAFAQEEPPARAGEAGGQVGSGFALELHLGSSLTVLNVTSSSFISLGGMSGGFFGGYKVGRATLGVGLELARVASSSSMSSSTPAPATSSDQSDTSVVIMPGVRVALLRTADSRVELYGQLDLGFGHQFSDSSSSPPPMMMPNQPTVDTSNFHFVYQVGPGVRYWLHPHFAIGAVALVRGDYGFSSSTTTSTFAGTSVSQTSSRNSAVTAINGALQVMGVF